MIKGVELINMYNETGDDSYFNKFYGINKEYLDSRIILFTQMYCQDSIEMESLINLCFFEAVKECVNVETFEIQFYSKMNEEMSPINRREIPIGIR